jgi:phage/plasmid-associated DNA primase
LSWRFPPCRSISTYRIIHISRFEPKNTIRKGIIDDIITFSTNNDIEFDITPYLFAFKNAVIDLRTGLPMTPKSTDYISTFVNYDYDFNLNPKLENELNGIIDTILPDAEEKNYYLTIQSTGLCGIQIENLFIATGTGGNGKSLINSLLMRTAGTYAYKLPSCILQNPLRTGACPELANLHKKRFVLIQEPDAKKRLCAETIKELTGDKTINARQLYSGNCETVIQLTAMLECNDLPVIDEVGGGVERRFRTIPFITKTVNQEDYDALEDKTNINVINPYYKTDEFQDKYKQAFFSILVKKFKVFYENKNDEEHYYKNS